MKRQDILHHAATVVCALAIVFAALQGLPVLLWLSMGFLVGRQVLRSVRRFRASGEPVNWVKLVGIGVLGVLVAGLLPDYIRENWVEAYKIPSASMVPSLNVGDHIFVNKRNAPKAGDIVVYKSGPQRQDYAKRIIAIGPAEVRVEGREVFVDGQALLHTPSSKPCPLTEECTLEMETTGAVSYPVIFQAFNDDAALAATTFVNQGEVYLLGDNRDASRDSRHHGAVPLSDVEGVMTMIWW